MLELMLGCPPRFLGCSQFSVHLLFQQKIFLRLCNFFHSYIYYLYKQQNTITRICNNQLLYSKHFINIYCIDQLMKCTHCQLIKHDVLCKNCYNDHKNLNIEGRTIMTAHLHQTKKMFESNAEKHVGSIDKLIEQNQRIRYKHQLKIIEDSIENTALNVSFKRENSKLISRIISEQEQILNNIIREREHSQSLVENCNQQHLSIRSSYIQCNSLIQKVLSEKIEDLIFTLNQNWIVCSKRQWQKFINMEEEQVGMYLLLLESETESEYLLQFNEQLRKQILTVLHLSKLLRVQLPYKIDMDTFENSHKFIFIERAQGWVLNRDLLRQYQANTIYLFSRFQVPLSYPQVEEGTIRQLKDNFLRHLRSKKQSILNQSDIEPQIDLTKAIYQVGLTAVNSEGSSEYQCLKQLSAQNIVYIKEQKRTIQRGKNIDKETVDLDQIMILNYSQRQDDEFIEILE